MLTQCDGRRSPKLARHSRTGRRAAGEKATQSITARSYRDRASLCGTFIARSSNIRRRWRPWLKPTQWKQAKEVLRQIIKYRFWISIGVAALFAVIAYFVGSGPIRDKAARRPRRSTAAENEVKKYTSPTIPTKEYKPIVEEKTQVVDQGRQYRLEDALRPPGPSADLARGGPGTVPELGPANGPKK